MTISILKVQIAALCMIFDTLQELHMLLGQVLVEVLKKNIGAHLRKFLHDTSENFSIPVQVFAYAHNTQPLSLLRIRP